MSPSQSTFVEDFYFWAACPHFLLIVPQREAANFRDLHRDLQEVTEREFRAWAGHVPNTCVVQETGSDCALERCG